MATTPMKQQRQRSLPDGINVTPNATMNSSQHRSLHTQLPRSRNNSRDLIGNEKAMAMSLGNGTISFAMDGTTGLQQHPQMLPPESPSGRSTMNATENRQRLNSLDRQQTYSNQYTTETNHLLPLERSHYILAQNVSFVVFISTYLTLIVILQLVSASIMSTATNVSISVLNPVTHYLYVLFSSSWTITNGLHCLITLLSLHWFKGSALFDEQGELNGMTIWEQMEATTESTTYMRRTFIIMPIGLAYIACLVNKFQPATCTVNLIILSIIMVAKLPFMYGVRLFGINDTPGFDDDIVLDNNITRTEPEHLDSNPIQISIPALHAQAPTLPYAKRD